MGGPSLLCKHRVPEEQREAWLGTQGLPRGLGPCRSLVPVPPPPPNSSVMALPGGVHGAPASARHLGERCRGAAGHGQGCARALHTSAPVPSQLSAGLGAWPRTARLRRGRSDALSAAAWGRAAAPERVLRLARRPRDRLSRAGAQRHPGSLGPLGAGGRTPRCGCRGAGCPPRRWGCIASPQPLDVTCNMDCAWSAPHGSCPGLGCGSDGGCQQRCTGVGHRPRPRPALEKGSRASRGAEGGKSACAAPTGSRPGLGHSEPPSPGTPEDGTQGSRCVLTPGHSWDGRPGQGFQTHLQSRDPGAMPAASMVCAGYSLGKSLRYSNTPAQALPALRLQHTAHGAAPCWAGPARPCHGEGEEQS